MHVLIPLVDNDGKRFRRKAWTEIESAAMRLFGGYSWYPATGDGGWRDEKTGKEYREPHRILIVSVDGLIGCSGKLHELARVALATFHQEAIYVRYLGLSEILR